MAMWVSITALLGACELQGQHAQPHVLKRRASLQAIEVIQEDPETGVAQLVAITDVAFKAGRWGEGRVLLINLEERVIVGAYYPLQANPLDLQRVEGGGFISLQAGTLTLGEQPVTAHASVSWHPSLTPIEPLELSWLTDPLGLSYPVSVALSPWESPTVGEPPALLMSSGVSGLVWRLAEGWVEPSSNGGLSALPAQSSRYAPLEQLSLGVLTSWQGRSLLVDFNADQLVSLREDGSFAPCRAQLGRFPEVMEGAQTPFVHEGSLFVSFGLSGELIELNLEELSWGEEACVVSRHSYSPALGAVPNDLIATREAVYVLHSAEQDIWVFDRGTGTMVERWQLPDQSHPWQMVKAKLAQGDHLLVTTWLSGELLSVDLHNGHVERVMSSEALSAPEPSACARPVAFDLEGGVALSRRWTELNFERSEALGEALGETSAEQGAAGSPSRVRPALLSGVPQLAFALDGGEGRVELELQRSPEGPWEPLGELLALPMSALRQAQPPSMFEASRVALIDPRVSLPDAPDPCERFNPSAQVIRTRIEPLGTTMQGRAPVHKLRLRLSESSDPIILRDVVYRAW